MTNDELSVFKEEQKKSWNVFAPLEMVTTMPAADLVNFAGITSSNTVLDVGCGTGVVAITAARLGAKVYGLDLCPELIERADYNAQLARVSVEFKEGDVESLPYPDNSFDVVVSQFGHMFAPRPSVAIKEMLRVLRPQGTIAFSTWPPDLFVGRLFRLVTHYVPLPAFVSPPPLWGDPHFVRSQLADRVKNLCFDQGVMIFPALSLGHYRESVEKTLAPVAKLVQTSKDDAALLSQFRHELEALAAEYFRDNHLHQHYLMSRGQKV